MINTNLNMIKTEPADVALLDYWKKLIPGDFDVSIERKRISFEFEMSGIDRGKSLISYLRTYEPIANKVVLDIGSGNGGLCIAAALEGAAKAFGLETVPQRILLANKWAECRGVDITFKEGVAENLPFENSTIDIVFFWSVIEHVQNHGKAIQEISRVLKPGGIVVINAPNRLSPQLFRSDPHYQSFGVSVLPPSVGKWWVVKVRKLSKSYGVGTFPIYSLLVRKLRKAGISEIALNHHNYMIDLLQQPDRIQSKLKRQLIKFLGCVSLNYMLALVLKNTVPIFLIVGRKNENQENRARTA